MYTFMTYMLFCVGGTIPTFLLSRLFMWLSKKIFNQKRIIISHVISLIVCGTVYSCSSDVNISFGLSLYALPQFFWLAYDFYSFVRKEGLLKNKEEDLKLKEIKGK